MAITFVGTLAASLNNGQALSIALDGTVTTTGGGSGGTIQSGDLMIACWTGFSRAPAITMSDSDSRTWIDIDDTVYGNNRLLVRALIAEDETGNTLDTTATGSGQDGVSLMVGVWRGVDQTTPFDGVTPTVAGTTSTNPDAAAIVPTSNNDCVVAVYGSNVIDTTGTAPPANYSMTAAITGNDNNDSQIGFIYRVLTGGGGNSENPGAITGYSSSTWRAITMALKPAPTTTDWQGTSVFAGALALILDAIKIGTWQGSSVLATSSTIAARATQRFVTNPARFAASSSLSANSAFQRRLSSIFVNTASLAASASLALRATSAFAATSTLALDAMKITAPMPISAVLAATAALAAASTIVKIFVDPVRGWTIASGVPSDWTQADGTFTLAVVADDASNGYSDRILQVSSLTDPGAITWDLPGTITDGEMLTLFKTTDAAAGADYISGMIRYQ